MDADSEVNAAKPLTTMCSFGETSCSISKHVCTAQDVSLTVTMSLPVDFLHEEAERIQVVASPVGSWSYWKPAGLPGSTG